MAESRRSPALLPPDPRVGRRRFGPMLLALVGVGCIGVVSAWRERLQPAQAAASIETTPPLVEATSLLRPFVAPAFIPMQAPAVRKPIDAFAEPIALGAVAKPAFAGAKYQLQTILLGRRGGSCLINGRACRVGDEVDGATVRSIGRDSVVLRLGRDEFELRMGRPNLAAR